jgi:hypothetical protein
MQSQHHATQVMTPDNGDPAEFLTNTFVKEDPRVGASRVRVFWAWHSTSDDADGIIEWEAPDHPRYRYGNDRALYKMYFSTDMRNSTETADASPAVKFAREFLPVVNQALLGRASAAPSETAPPTAGTKPAA